MTSTFEKAETLRRLHHLPEILVLVNVWDVASARTVAALPGCRAIATASWSIDAAHGVPDGERVSRDERLAGGARRAGGGSAPWCARSSPAAGPPSPCRSRRTSRPATARRRGTSARRSP